MPILSVELYTPPVKSLQRRVASIIHRNAISYLHCRPELITVQVRFAQLDEAWFFNDAQLDRASEPTYHANAIIGAATANDLDVYNFIAETRKQVSDLLGNTFPGTVFPVLPDRNKVTVLVMP